MSNFERLRREAEQRIEYNRRLEAERKRLEAIEVAEAIRRIQEHNRIINERYNEAFLVEPKQKNVLRAIYYQLKRNHEGSQGVSLEKVLESAVVVKLIFIILNRFLCLKFKIINVKYLYMLKIVLLILLLVR